MPRPPNHRDVQELPEPAVFTAAASRWREPLDAGRIPAAGCAVSVGNFDGVHLGHAALARRLRAAADRLGVPAVALTFDPHPASLVRPGTAPVPLTTPARRAELLLALGLDAVLVQPVDRTLLGLAADAFHRDVLRGRLRAAAIVEGPDFRFGAGRVGDVDLLRRLCAADGVTIEVVEPVVADGGTVSSSRIRALVAAGDVAAANALLTAPFRATGTVVTGARRGAALGFPTANLADVATLVPGAGVYAARALVRGDVGRHPAAVHVGCNVTFDETVPTVEAHLVGFAGDCYGRMLDVDFLQRLRDTRRFDSAGELVAQMARDVAAAIVVAQGDGGT
ncbi:MAG: riboflavin biosynthesis protein RibF [Planctomycetaceae bacterium]